jgi:hypothetical protein
MWQSLLVSVSFDSMTLTAEADLVAIWLVVARTSRSIRQDDRAVSLDGVQPGALMPLILADAHSRRSVFHSARPA